MSTRVFPALVCDGAVSEKSVVEPALLLRMPRGGLEMMMVRVHAADARRTAHFTSQHPISENWIQILVFFLLAAAELPPHSSRKQRSIKHTSNILALVLPSFPCYCLAPTLIIYKHSQSLIASK